MIFIIPRSWKGVFAYGIIGLIIIVYNVSLEYEKLQLNNFQTRRELGNFLNQDLISENKWTAWYTCDDFTDDLIKNAENKKYLLEKAIVENPNALWPNSQGYWEGEGPHALCIAYIESENKWYYIEPQTDEILGVYKYYTDRSDVFRDLAELIMKIENKLST